MTGEPKNITEATTPGGFRRGRRHAGRGRPHERLARRSDNDATGTGIRPTARPGVEATPDRLAGWAR
jgi:hypothetical protein